MKDIKDPLDIFTNWVVKVNSKFVVRLMTVTKEYLCRRKNILTIKS